MILLQKKKKVTVSWSKVCSTKIEGGLGLKSLKAINNASILKLCWELVSSNRQWAVLIRARVYIKGSYIIHYISSSIWSGLKTHFKTVLANSRWLIGDGMMNSLNARLGAFIQDGKWKIPSMIINRSPSLLAELD